MFNENAEIPTVKDPHLHVMLIGNNPIELSKVEGYLKAMASKGIISEIAFDLKSFWQRMSSFQPHYILIDDNVGRGELKSIVQSLANSKQTQEIPVAVIKNSNFHESFCNEVSEYLLKSTLTEESLYKTIINSLRFRKTRAYLYKKYRKRKMQLKELVGIR